MSRITISNITNLAGNGPVTLENGLFVGAGATVNGDVTIAGVVTAAAFVGDGSGLINLTTTSKSYAVAFKWLHSFDECHSPRS
jgi:hypothetical protein